MRREQAKQTFKLHLLALVLALALLWYLINPASAAISQIKSEGELPDEKRRESKPQLQRGAALPVTFQMSEKEIAASPILIEDEDDFEWPEFIDA